MSYTTETIVRMELARRGGAMLTSADGKRIEVALSAVVALVQDIEAAELRQREIAVAAEREARLLRICYTHAKIVPGANGCIVCAVIGHWDEKYCALADEQEKYADSLVAAERAACARAVCKGCAEGWPLDPEHDYGLHILPPESRPQPTEYARGTHTGCDAWEIRQRAKPDAVAAEAPRDGA